MGAIGQAPSPKGAALNSPGREPWGPSARRNISSVQGLRPGLLKPAPLGLKTLGRRPGPSLPDWLTQLGVPVTGMPEVISAGLSTVTAAAWP